MAAFSYQYQCHPFLFDPVICTHDSSFKFSGLVSEAGQINATTMTTAANCLSQIYPSEVPHHHHHHHHQQQQQQLSVDVVGGVVHDTSYCLSSSKVDNEPSVTTKAQTTTPESSSVMDNKPEFGEQVNQKMGTNKRKSKALNSAQSKDAREGIDKKQRKFINGSPSDKMPKTAEKNQKEGPEEEKGYIHVRARRGQATDSHSLAERVRRERISERMKLLQAIVPGCDKITGKALMLDEIINYVQSLQNQVEFLSMKLASLNPMFYDFGMDMDAMNIRQETLSSLASSAFPSGHQISPTQPVDNISTNFTTVSINEYPLPESSLLIQHRPNDYSQDNGSLLWGLEDDQTQKFINQFGLTNGMSSFH